MEKTKLVKKPQPWFKRKGFLFTFAYSLAIIAWFGYSTLNGLAMADFMKLKQSWKSSGSSYSTMHHK